jgi:DNA-binding beta-propeller fold protein YncE
MYLRWKEIALVALLRILTRMRFRLNVTFAERRYSAMKKLAIVIVVFSVFLASAAFRVAWANPWAVVANHDELTIHTIDLGTDPPTVYGPFLEGKLGTSGPLLDVAVTPDGHYALVSNFGSCTVYRIDLSDPANPTLDGFVDIGFEAQDIDIASNGEFALVVDGVSGNTIAIIDLIDFPQFTTDSLTFENACAVGVAIAPDNRTVILCDDFNGGIIYGELDPTTGLKSENELITEKGIVNVAISPYDGQTVLVANDVDDTVSVFRISEPGKIEPGELPEVKGLPGGEQSIAFSPDRERAYVVSYAGWRDRPDQLSWLKINERGVVELGEAGVVTLDSKTGGFFGVDVLAITPDGSHALVGNPGSSVDPSNPSTTTYVTMIDLSNNWNTTKINTGSKFPGGIAVFNQSQPSVVPVYADIRPGCCPNHLELRGWGDMPVAVLGTVDFEVTDIDVTTLRLSREGKGKGVGPRPILWRYKDVSTPFEGRLCECHKLGPDGYEDLTLKFRNREIVEALGEVKVGDEIVLTIRGKLLNGNEFEGIDCIKVIWGRCPVSTAAEGSRLAKDAEVLRKMRDRYLSANYLGRIFVSLYYEQSPKLADFISKYPFLKSFVRVGLYPWVKASRLVIE